MFKGNIIPWVILVSTAYVYAKEAHVESEVMTLLRSVQTEMSEMRSTMDHFRDQLKEMQDFKTAMEAQQQPSIYNAYTAHGCLYETLTLSCTDGRWINVTDGLYGQYGKTCDTACCGRSPEDCSIRVIDNSPENWIALKALCDNKTDCSYTYMGEIINDCELGYIADYLEISYDCLPETGDAPAAFTAYASEPRQYNEGDVVIFDKILSNFGNHYDPSTSYFTCPYNGIYLFGVNFYAVVGEYMYVQFMKGSTESTKVLADNDSGVYIHAGAQIIIDCSIGEVVWIRNPYDGGAMFSNTIDAQSTFYGYIIQRL